MLRAGSIARITRRLSSKTHYSPQPTLAPAVGQGGFFELRTDEVLPSELSTYLDAQNSTAHEKQKLLPGWIGAWKTELGGSVHTVQHLYHHSSYDERDRMSMDAERERVASTDAAAFLEATDVLHSCGLPGAAGFAPPPDTGGRIAWELRSYQLILGYTSVPRFLELYSAGLKDKLAADDSGASQLATLLYSDCGPLNVVHELWRHESMQRAQDSRVASRKAAKWKEAIGEIASLTTSFKTRYMRPLLNSPWR